ncbi:MAG: hypothetical protein SFU53_09765 [Terrimicrobiaceae bacterium]|nr:hypothetical protein [Terrimicrobiaceae bacterium]
MRVLLGIVAAAFLTASATAHLPRQEPAREWTVGGRLVRASLSGIEGDAIELKLPDGKREVVPLSELSDADRKAVEDWRENRPIEMPESAGIDGPVPVEVVNEEGKDGRYIYRTPHFEFISEGRLTQALLRDVARNFEATYELLRVLPWGIDPRPEEGDRFRALLVRSRTRYQEEGGPPNSGGVYFRSRAMFIVPFDSLGLRPVGNSFSKASDYSSETLVHELTHQMMNAWLSILPIWVTEGTAEYAALLPLRFGVFRVSSAKSAFRDYIDRLERRDGGVPEPYPIEKLFWVTDEDWSATLARDPAESRRLYFTSYLLVYYFMHLDGEGDGRLFVRYMRDVGKVKREVEAYFDAVAEFKKNPEVEVLADGRYRWPSTLTHPTRPAVLESEEKRREFEQQTLAILLNGRTTEELMDEIRTAYRRLGLRL